MAWGQVQRQWHFRIWIKATIKGALLFFLFLASDFSSASEGITW
jgi:hypothetical protein